MSGQFKGREDARSFVDAFHLLLEAEELQREKGKDPVGFLLRRIDFTGSVLHVTIYRAPLERESCRLEWWPNGRIGRYVRSTPRPTPVFDASPMSAVATATWVQPVRMAYDFQISERSAWEHADATLAMLAPTLARQCGEKPRVLSEGDAMRQVRPDWGRQRFIPRPAGDEKEKPE